MPKVVDHDARRSEIVAATCAVIATEGLEAATMRRIASETHSTTGLVTHYFASKQELLIAALRHVHGLAGKRMLATLADPSPDNPLRAILEEALPLDQERLQEWRVWLAFWAQASLHPALASEQKDRYVEWTAMLRQVSKKTVTDIDLDALMALIDGLGSRAALNPTEFPAKRQLAVIDQFLK